MAVKRLLLLGRPGKRAKFLSSFDEKITSTGGEEKCRASREDLQMDDPCEMHEKIKKYS